MPTQLTSVQSIKAVFLTGALLLLQACTGQVTTVVSSDDIKRTENSAYTSEGRYFFIGEKPGNGSWIFEMTKNPQTGEYTPTPLVKGSYDGTDNFMIGGSPRGSACIFNSLAAKGTKLYAVCSDKLQIWSKVSLFEVDTAQHTRTVRVGRITKDNRVGSVSFSPHSLFANGLAVDDAGDLYLSNSQYGSLTHKNAIIRIDIDEANSYRSLVLSHSDLFEGQAYQAGLFPNGVQIEGDTLYFATSNEIRKLTLQRSGSDVTPVNAHAIYRGALIDDFDIEQGYIAATFIAPGKIAILPPSENGERVSPLVDFDVPFSPSSVRLQPAVDNPLFPENTFVITSQFQGGLYLLNDFE